MLDIVLLILLLLCTGVIGFWYHQIQQALKKRIGKNLGSAEPYIEKRMKAIQVTSWLLGLIGIIKLLTSLPAFIDTWFS